MSFMERPNPLDIRDITKIKGRATDISGLSVPSVILPNTGAGQGRSVDVVERESEDVGTSQNTNTENWIAGQKNLLDLIKNLGASEENVSYSGSDCKVCIGIGGITFPAVQMTNLSCSSYRAKSPVRALGLSTPKGYVSGSRTIAGSIVMNCGATHPFMKMLTSKSSDIGVPSDRYIIPDQIPPFNMYIFFSSETYQPPVSADGERPILTEDGVPYVGSIMELFNVHLLTDSMVISVDDLILEITMNFVALAYSPIRDPRLAYNSPRFKDFQDKTLEILQQLQALENKSTNQAQKSAATPPPPEPEDPNAREPEDGSGVPNFEPEVEEDDGILDLPEWPEVGKSKRILGSARPVIIPYV